MKFNTMSVSTAMLCAGWIATAGVADVQTDVMPNGFAKAAGDTNFTGPMTFGERTNQMILHESQLTELVGRQLTGISFRLPSNANSPWPAQDVTYNFYNIFLSDSVNPEDRSFTFAENIVGEQTQVRSGVLAVPTGSYPDGSSPNQFGPVIEFTTPWTYTGGNLLVEIRHPGNGVSSRAVDAVNTTNPDYGTLFSALWQADANGTDGAFPARFSIMQFTSIPGDDDVTGDLNGDGVVNVSDLLILLAQWGECPTGGDCTADLNDDGVVNVSDLLILLGNWG